MTRSEYIYEYYQKEKENKKYQEDSQQDMLISLLTRLEKECISYYDGFLSRMYRPAPKPIYIWGPVGAGKSFAMDCFFASSRIHKKIRVHFHTFMRKLYEDLKEYAYHKNPLSLIADDLSEKINLLCFDEFHISDIADAMMLGELFRIFLDKKITIVTTSNYHPSTLYPDGLQRERFEPTIKMILDTFLVVTVDPKKDYRSDIKHNHVEQRFYLCSGTCLDKVFESLTQHKAEPSIFKFADQRELKTLGSHAKILYVSFEKLCGDPLGKEDYFQILNTYDHVLLEGLYPLSDNNSFSIARRFMWLIDLCYEQKTTLYFSSTCLPKHIYPTGLFSNEFTRTLSRLNELCNLEAHNT